MRPTFDGITYAIDPYGRMLGRTDRATGTRAMLLVDVPTRGVATVYARFGDWLAWLSMVALLLCSIAAIANPHRRHADGAVSARQRHQCGGG